MELHSITFPGLPEPYKVAPASHLEDKNNPHGVTPAQIGALSSLATYYPDASNVDIDTVTDGLMLVSATLTKNCPVPGFVFILQMFYGAIEVNRNRVQVAFPYKAGNSGASFALRSFNNGVWSAWRTITPKEIGAAPAVESADNPSCYYKVTDGVVEWLNPPMLLGVEYRTTKRHNGKVVYSKAISIGKMPVSSARYDNLVTGVDEVVDYIFTMSSYQERYTNNSHVKTLGRNTSAGSVFAEIVTEVNISTFDAYLTISYTKV